MSWKTCNVYKAVYCHIDRELWQSDRKSVKISAQPWQNLGKKRVWVSRTKNSRHAHLWRDLKLSTSPKFRASVRKNRAENYTTGFQDLKPFFYLDFILKNTRFIQNFRTLHQFWHRRAILRLSQSSSASRWIEWIQSQSKRNLDISCHGIE